MYRSGPDYRAVADRSGRGPTSGAAGSVVEFRAQLQDLWKENREREEVRWRHALGRRLLACFDQLKLMAAHCGLNPDLPPAMPTANHDRPTRPDRNNSRPDEATREPRSATAAFEASAAVTPCSVVSDWSMDGRDVSRCTSGRRAAHDLIDLDA